MSFRVRPVVGQKEKNIGTFTIINVNNDVTSLGVINSSSGFVTSGSINMGQSSSINVNSQQFLTSGNLIDFNTKLGQNAGQNATGNNNTLLGCHAGQNATGSYNVLIGTDAGTNRVQDASVCIGVSSGQNSTSYGLVAIGLSSGQADVSNAGRNTFVGTRCGQSNITGQSNAFFGASAGQNNNNGNFNVFMGRNAGNANVTGSGNTLLGHATQATNQTDCVVIGRASTASATGAIALGVSVTANQSGFFVNPVRSGVISSANVAYDISTKELQLTSSSIRKKNNVTNLARNTSVIYDVVPREFDWKENNSHDVGVIAEEVDELDTYFTFKNEHGEPAGINWNVFILYLLTEQVQALTEQVQALTEQVQALTNEEVEEEVEDETITI